MKVQRSELFHARWMWQTWQRCDKASMRYSQLDGVAGVDIGL